VSAADERLAEAIGEALHASGFLREGEILGDWHVMCEVTMLDPEGRGRTKYANIIPGEQGIPMHRVRGLIDVCTELLDDDE
jgi:hypothetical protein